MGLKVDIVKAIEKMKIESLSIKYKLPISHFNIGTTWTSFIFKKDDSCYVY